VIGRGMADMNIVLLPGLDGTGVMFEPLLAVLPAELEPIVIAYPHNESLGYNELLPRVLGALPTDKPFVLLGESFSGPLALMAAATCPPNLMGMILCATFVRNPVKWRPAWLKYFARPMFFRFFPAMSRIKAAFNRDATPELRELSARKLSTVHPSVLAHRVRSVLEVDVISQLLRCPVPILYLMGVRDRVVPGHNMRDIVRARPDVQVVRVPSAHWVLQSQPQLAADAIAQFAGDCA
jgi:pimeloyl-ACP methyl ester carboxylesterase